MSDLNVQHAYLAGGIHPRMLLDLCAMLLLAMGLIMPVYAADEESAGNSAEQLTDTAQPDDALLELFEDLDANDDGTISINEAKAETNLHASYKDADINTDGRLNKTEFSSFQSQQGVKPSDVSDE